MVIVRVEMSRGEGLTAGRGRMGHRSRASARRSLRSGCSVAQEPRRVVRNLSLTSCQTGTYKGGEIHREGASQPERCGRKPTVQQTGGTEAPPPQETQGSELSEVEQHRGAGAAEGFQEQGVVSDTTGSGTKQMRPPTSPGWGEGASSGLLGPE